MWVSISAGRHLNNCPPRVVDASTNLCQCLLQFTFSKLIVMTMMMNISEYLLDCCCPYVLFIHFWSTAKYSPNLIVFHFAGTFSKQLSHSIQPCARWGSSGARWGPRARWGPCARGGVQVHGGGKLPWKEKILKPECQSMDPWRVCPVLGAGEKWNQLCAGL